MPEQLDILTPGAEPPLPQPEPAQPAPLAVDLAFAALQAYRQAWKARLVADEAVAYYGAKLRALLGERTTVDIMGWTIERLEDGELRLWCHVPATYSGHKEHQNHGHA